MPSRHSRIPLRDENLPVDPVDPRCRRLREIPAIRTQLKRGWQAPLGVFVAAMSLTRTSAPNCNATAGYPTASASSKRSVTNMQPGLCVMTSGRHASAMAACGVTPQAQNTGNSPSAIGTGSP
jgi:hypothetical protein